MTRTNAENFSALVEDFEAMWDGIASLPSARVGRGNFILAFHAMLLLEWAGRLVDGDASSGTAFANALRRRNPRYFARLPGTVVTPAEVSFLAQRNETLLALVFDLVRNGIGHGYADVVATLTDAIRIDVELTGASPGRTLTDEGTRTNLSVRHLANENRVQVVLHPNLLFLDVRHAAVEVGLPASPLVPPVTLERPRGRRTPQRASPSTHYNWSSGDFLREMLASSVPIEVA